MNGRSIRGLCEDGYPMDFMQGPTAREKRVLWQRSVDRAYAQHPYAGILVARHAEYLYRDNLAHTPENEQRETEAFLQALTLVARTVCGVAGSTTRSMIRRVAGIDYRGQHSPA